MRVLIVEDNSDLAATIGDFLALNSHQVDFAGDGQVALNLLEREEFDALILDINMPRMDGLKTCKSLRAGGNGIPILMLTARDTLEDIVSGFESGTDDYLVKPFALEEMLARLLALGARGLRRDTGMLRVADLELNIGAHSAVRDGRVLPLNRLQFELLKTLALASPRVVSRETLEYVIWQGEAPDGSALRTHIYRLRNVVDKGFDEALIETVHGQGFRIAGHRDAI